MATSRSYEQTINELSAKRRPGTIIKFLAGFISAGGGFLCLVDLFLFLGFAITFTSLIFAPFAIIGILGGAYFAIKGIRDDARKIKEEKEEYERCRSEQISRQAQVDELISQLNELRQLVVEQQILQEIDKQLLLLKNKYKSIDEANQCLRTVGNAINSIAQRFQLQPIQLNGIASFPQVEASQASKAWQKTKKVSNRILSGFNGFSAAIGAAGSLIGVAAISTLLMTPVGWSIFAGVIAVALLVGIGTALVEYKFNRSQDNAINRMREEGRAIASGNTTIANMSVRVSEIKSKLLRDSLEKETEKNKVLETKIRLLEQDKKEEKALTSQQGIFAASGLEISASMLPQEQSLPPQMGDRLRDNEKRQLTKQ